MRATQEPLSRNGPRLVRDAMQLTVVTVVPEMTVRELVQVLLESTITGAPVVDSRGKIVGVVSVTDVMRLVARDPEVPAGQLLWRPVLPAPGGDDEMDPEEILAFTSPDGGVLPEAVLDHFRVRDIMTPVAFSVRPTDSIGTAIRFLVRGRIHRVLVVEDGILHGIVTPYDILQGLDWE